MRVALYGGSFDPPHFGHEMVVQKALKELEIEKLFITPTWINPFKKEFFAPPHIREQWIRAIWEDELKVEICTYELENKRATSTIETVEYLYKHYPIKKCFCIVGADNLASLSKWDRYEELVQKVEFVVATREDAKVPKNLKKLQINATISSSKIRETSNFSAVPPIIRKSVEKFYKDLSMSTISEKIISFLDEKKGENIQVFDMKAQDYFVDTVIIATTMGERHALALMDELKKMLKKEGEKYLHVEASGEWVILDLGDTLVHLMSSEYRARYNLEAFLSDFENSKKQEQN